MNRGIRVQIPASDALVSFKWFVTMGSLNTAAQKRKIIICTSQRRNRIHVPGLAGHCPLHQRTPHKVHRLAKTHSWPLSAQLDSRGRVWGSRKLKGSTLCLGQVPGVFPGKIEEEQWPPGPTSTRCGVEPPAPPVSQRLPGSCSPEAAHLGRPRLMCLAVLSSPQPCPLPSPSLLPSSMGMTVPKAGSHWGTRAMISTF